MTAGCALPGGRAFGPWVSSPRRELRDEDRVPEVERPVDGEVLSFEDEGLMLRLSACGASGESPETCAPADGAHEVPSGNGAGPADLVMGVGEAALDEKAARGGCCCIPPPCGTACGAVHCMSRAAHAALGSRVVAYAVVAGLRTAGSEPNSKGQTQARCWPPRPPHATAPPGCSARSRGHLRQQPEPEQKRLRATLENIGCHGKGRGGALLSATTWGRLLTARPEP